jgi:N4-gp56 family major capsid protein
MKTIQELLTTGKGTEGSLLIEKKIYGTLIEAVEKKRIGRGKAAFIMGPSEIPGSSIDIDLATPNSTKLYLVAEGGGVPIDVVDYTSFNMKPDKYGVRVPVTKEMMEDGKWNLIEHNIKVAGQRVADNEDLLIIRDALDSASNTQSGGAAATISDITRMMQYLEDSDYTATDFIVGPEVANDLRNIDTFVEANKLGTREMFETGFIGRIYGMDVVRFSTNAAPSTTYSKYAYIIDKNHAFCMAEKRPVTIEDYDDKIHDLSGAVVTQRIKVKALRAAAICKLTTS